MNSNVDPPRPAAPEHDTLEPGERAPENPAPAPFPQSRVQVHGFVAVDHAEDLAQVSPELLLVGHVQYVGDPVRPDGSVSLCELQGTDMNAPSLGDQVLARVRTFDFGAKDGIPAVTILYPIDFLPAT